MYETVQDGLVSPVQSDIYPIHSPATRIGVNGATMNLFGGLRLPIYPGCRCYFADQRKSK